MAAGELKLPSAQLSIASLADTVKASEKAKEEKEKQRQRMKKVRFVFLEATSVVYMACIHHYLFLITNFNII
jgi:predicted nucleic acid-binding Zn ribbon protein